MELEGLRRGLRILHDAGVIVQGIVTDRHMQIAKFLRETYQQIDHRYDVWHIAKGNHYIYTEIDIVVMTTFAGLNLPIFPLLCIVIIEL